jgi:hypothetical protein
VCVCVCVCVCVRVLYIYKLLYAGISIANLVSCQREKYLYTCPHTTMYVSSYYYMCPHTTVHDSYYYMCVLIIQIYVSYILLHMCPMPFVSSLVFPLQSLCPARERKIYNIYIHTSVYRHRSLYCEPYVRLERDR